MPASSVFKPGSTALITGAASGIGLAVAKLCHDKGMKLVLADIDTEALEDIKHDFGKNVATYFADVSNIQDWEKLKREVEAEFGTIELLVLNAGRTKKGGFGDGDYFRDVLETNLFGVIHGINTFLPTVQKASETNPTSIVITGSKQGITNPPGNPAYNASKAAVKSLAEQLSYNLKDSTTSVHLLIPGWTFTRIAGGGPGKVKPAGAWEPSQVADYLYEKMGEDKFYIVCPDNDVTEETDKKRMLWSVGDIVHGRPPLSRWRDEWKQEAAETMDKTDVS